MFDTVDISNIVQTYLYMETCLDLGPRSAIPVGLRAEALLLCMVQDPETKACFSINLM